ncbi:MAG TPA: nitrous oxide reductase accessory protein NosL [Ottowia sp.]|uniref:nitrous oxide reductase accessory protein NosL n=1 Tax=Ottowia sp. TaxID=1898956 RepID=UPI002CD523C3|nr:nitrous oxide reductase accessory protein NosL [Ottowia sp.]HMN21211.1 nitrous oxide reductase accessory protein NosL [Ottowia sp.]
MKQQTGATQARSRAALRCTALLLACGMLAAGCERAPQPSAAPPAVEIGGDVRFEAVGYYCGMLLADHPGPKGQIHLTSRAQPLWFSSVRDAIAFTRLPEEPRDIVAIYVNDMGRASNWEQPEAGTWVEARQAWFVVDSSVRGGMGAPEAIPFAQEAAAEAFRQRHGGRIVRLAQVPDAYVLGPVDLVPQSLSPSGLAAPARSADPDPSAPATVPLRSPP